MKEKKERKREVIIEDKNRIYFRASRNAVERVVGVRVVKKKGTKRRIPRWRRRRIPRNRESRPGEGVKEREREREGQEAEVKEVDEGVDEAEEEEEAEEVEREYNRDSRRITNSLLFGTFARVGGSVKVGEGQTNVSGRETWASRSRLIGFRTR
ncbi:hypothetical protein PUN28_005368 [Cardiocondyla obscurior]|uniref:Uncharacterized protein n=1 Tax=Cardiocondyla obscurior TaxID=286306 RepID=A0AAW2GK55_9HYME